MECRAHDRGRPSYLLFLPIALPIGAALSLALSFGSAHTYSSSPPARFAHARIDSCGTPSFAPAVGYEVGSSPIFVTTDDFNQDGKLDLVAAYQGSNVAVLLGTGTGTFGAAR